MIPIRLLAEMSLVVLPSQGTGHCRPGQVCPPPLMT